MKQDENHRGTLWKRGLNLDCMRLILTGQRKTHCSVSLSASVVKKTRIQYPSGNTYHQSEFAPVPALIVVQLR